MAFGDNCCECDATAAVDKCYLVTRLVGGFAEYIITHPTDNPVTYFTGRRYMEATYAFSLVYTEMSCSCAQAGDLGFNTPDAPIETGYTGSYDETYAPYTNVPTITASGTDQVGTIRAIQFQKDGFASQYHNDGYGTPGGWQTGRDLIDGSISGLCDLASFAFELFAVGFCQSPGSNPWGGFALLSPYPCGVFGEVSAGPCSSSITGTDPEVTLDEFTSSGWVYNGAGNVEAAMCDINVSTGCTDSWSLKCDFTSSSAAGLENELDYDDHHDTVIDAITDSIQSSAVAGCNYYSFADFIPLEDPVDWPTDFSPYDGSLVGPDVRTGDDHGFSTDTFPNLDNLGVCPCGSSIVQCVPFPKDDEDRALPLPSAATYYDFRAGDTDANDAFGTYLISYGMHLTSAFTGGILTTWIVLNDYSFVLDEDTDCVDLDPGDQWLPPPSAKDLPTDLYAVDEFGGLTGPVGRMTIVIPGTTCADWDGTLPPLEL